jgi:hypothetical protein
MLGRLGKQGRDFLPLRFGQQRTGPRHQSSFGAADLAYLSFSNTQPQSFQGLVPGCATASSVSCSRATTASRLAIPSSHSRETLALSGGTVNCGNGGKMPKRCGIGCISLSLLAALDWCKRTAGRYWPFSAGIVSSITPGHRNDQVEGGQSTKVGRPVQIESCVERIELKEFTKALNIGDRIQVLCDDGVLVAEKISQTQFELIHAQMLSELVH